MNKTTVTVASVVFALVGALVTAAIAPSLSQVSAQPECVQDKSCGEKNSHRPYCSIKKSCGLEHKQTDG